MLYKLQYMISQKPHVLENVKCHLCKGLKTSIIPIHLVVSNNDSGSDNANSIEVKTSPHEAEEDQEDCCGTTVEVQIGRASCAELVTEKSGVLAGQAAKVHGTAISEETCEESQTVFNNASSQTDEKLW